MKKRILCMAIVALLTFVLCGAALAETTPVGINLSGISTTDLDGNAVTGEIFTRYKLTILNMWATWCSPCVGELPHLQKLHTEYESKGVNVVGILCEDSTSTVAAAKKLIESKGLTYDMILFGRDATLAKMANSSGGYIPVTFVIDSTGTILHYAVGSMSYNQFVKLVNDYLPSTDPTPTPIMHTVVFADWDDKVLSTQLVADGEAAVPPTSPTREGYVFTCWDEVFSTVFSDMRIHALYNRVGDVNSDSEVNTGDAVLILVNATNNHVYSDYETSVADINSDGVVNTGDATALLKLVVG